MKYVGIDLHKKTSVICIVNKERKVLQRHKFSNTDMAGIAQFFRELGPFEFAVEASGSYEWLVNLLAPLAQNWVLVNPSKFLLIAKTTKKTDRHDAQQLAEFLALGMLPKAYYPSPKEREHRQLARYRVQCRRRVNQIVCRIRQVATRYNADCADLLKSKVMEEFRKRSDLSDADRFVLKYLVNEHRHAEEVLEVALTELRHFAGTDTATRQREREILQTAPGVGTIISDVVLAELGNVQRFDSIKDVSAYAGLVPKLDESGDKSKQLNITKAGSKLLRWAMVQAAWQAIHRSVRWSAVYEGIKKRRGSKRAVIAVARRLLGVLVSMLKNDQEYRFSLAELKQQEARDEARQQRRKAKAAQKESPPEVSAEPSETTPARKKTSRKRRAETTVLA